MSVPSVPSAPPKPESPLARTARERREAATAAGKRPPATMPRTKLKRAKVRTVEVEKPPLLVKVSDLSPHPLLGRLGLIPDLISREEALGLKASGSNREDHQDRADELKTRFAGFVDSILDHGLLEPIKVVKTLTGYLIADGRNRWQACSAIAESSHDDPAREAVARRIQSNGVPCVEITEAEVPGVILGSLNNRHLSKQARALVALTIHPEVAEENQAGRKSRNDCAITLPELAGKVGVSLRTMVSACEFWRELALKKPARREELINQVFAGISFSNVLIGDMGAEKTKGKPVAPVGIGGHLLKAANSMARHFGHYPAMTREAQVAYLSALTKAVAVAPPEVIATLRNCLTES